MVEETWEKAGDTGAADTGVGRRLEDIGGVNAIGQMRGTKFGQFGYRGVPEYEREQIETLTIKFFNMLEKFSTAAV